MQNDEKQKPDLDADILQCKLDLQRALQAGKRVPPKAASPEINPTQTLQPLQPLSSEHSSEPKPPISEPSGSPSSPVGIHILPFESLQKKITSAEQTTVSVPPRPEPDVSPEPEAPPPPQEPVEPMDEKLRLLEEQLETSTRSADTQQSRIEDLERELAERQQQLEALREELSDAQQRLEQADSANALLVRENTELLETLNYERLEAEREREDAVSEFEMTDEETDEFDDSSLDPYCESTEEVISEDDVHLEQKLGGNEVPTFNLAEQIMAEQRRASSERRQGPARSGKKTPSSDSIEHVMKQYLTDSPAPPPREQQHRPAGHSERFLRWHGEGLTAYQTELLDAIIQNDIRRFCGTDVSFSAYHSTMDN